MAEQRPRAALVLRGVGVRYGRQTVLEGLDLEVAPGESFALVGVNGAGKTTCIKALLDFCEVAAGSIEIYDRRWREPRARAPLAYLPERFLPPYYLRGDEFLRLMGRLYGVAPGAERVAGVLADLDLDPRALAKPVRALSKGMAQKLGLAACLLSERPLAVLDEPLSGLDPKARLLAMRRLGRWRAEGRGLFFSTHLLGDVERLCDRLGVLHGGRLRFVGTPEALCRRYRQPDLEQAYLACIEAR